MERYEYLAAQAALQKAKNELQEAQRLVNETKAAYDRVRYQTESDKRPVGRPKFVRPEPEPEPEPIQIQLDPDQKRPIGRPRKIPGVQIVRQPVQKRPVGRPRKIEPL